jgi:hypothetical protein
MSSFNYGEMQAVADELIGEFGQAGAIITITPPDEINGGDPVPVSHPCRLVTMAYDQRYINGSTILAGDVQIYISAIGLDVEPLVGMQVSAGGKTYLIVSIDPNRFDGQTPVVFIAQGRTAS